MQNFARVNRFVIGLFVTSILCGALAADAATFYVSPAGDDSNPGTQQRPFVTIQRARDEIRKLKMAGQLPAEGVVVEIAAGRYSLGETLELTAEDSGTAQSPIVYRSDPESRAWLFAGREIPVSALQPLTDPDLLARIPKEARPYVRCLDLKTAGIHYYVRLPDRFNRYAGRLDEKLGYKPEYGYVPGRWTPMEVFCDGRDLVPARWPNNDYVHIDEVIDDGEGDNDAAVRPGTFSQPSLKEKLRLWAGAEELILNGYFYRDYFCYSTRVAKLDPEKCTITLREGILDKQRKPHQRFFVHHLPEELDCPGEWYLKRSTGLLCLWPPKDAQTLMFPVMPDSMVRLSGARYLTIQGLGLEGGRLHGVEVFNGENSSIIGCEVRNIGGDGVTIYGGHNHRVIGCDIHHTGRGGIQLSGGDRKTLEPAGHVAENNHIHHTSRLQRNYASPLTLKGVGCRVSRNLIHDIPHIAIHFSGNEHVMEFNEIFSVLYETNEAGVFYTGRDWTARGNVIRYNFIHHTTGVPDWGVRFVHLDDLTSGTEIYGNVCYKLEDGIAVCGGHDNKIHDNLFVQCKETIDLASRGIDMFQSDGKGGFVLAKDAKYPQIAKRLIEYKWNQPPYSERYPKLVEVFKMNPIAAPWWNDIQRNIAVDCSRHIRQTPQSQAWLCSIEDNWSGLDPGFVEPDHTKLDFRFKPDCEAYSKTKFQPIPFDKIGVYASPDRASWPVECRRPPADWKPRWLAHREAITKSPVQVFPVADVKKGRTIVIDGAVNNEEWSPPGYDGNEPERHQAATIEYLPNGQKDASPTTALIETDGTALLVAFVNELAPGQPISRTHRWGKDDAVEVSLALTAPPEATPRQERPFIFRGYPDGHVEGSAESGWTDQDVTRSMREVQFGARIVDARTWTAEFRIPFESLSLSDPAGVNRPILANLTVYKAAAKSWLQWKKPSGRSWDVQGGWALWLKPFGPLACLPGCLPSLVRIDIALPQGTPPKSFEAGPGVEVPAWAKDGNRLCTTFGSVGGDRWREFKFQFASHVDAKVQFHLMGAKDAWTYYDDFRVEGAEFTNPDFEIANQDGAIPGWGFALNRERLAGGYSKAAIVCPPDGAASGLRAARANESNRVTKTLAVKQGQPVTIRFKARAALPVTQE